MTSAAASSEELVARLTALMQPDALGARWLPMNPSRADEGTLEQLEAELGVRVPDDLRAVMRAFGGGTLTRPGASPMGLGPLSDIDNMNANPDFTDALPGMFFFGGTGGGEVYFYDPEDRLGRGAYSIYIVSMGDMAIEAACYVAASLAEACDAVLAGEDFHRRPPVGRAPS